MARAERKGDGLKDETPGVGAPRASEPTNICETAGMSNLKSELTYDQSGGQTAEIIPFRPADVIESHGGRLVTTSLKVAEIFGKRHKDVTRKLQALDCSKEFTERNFAPSEYTDPTGRKLPMWEVTKDGFVFLVMGFTGKRAAQFKEAYIEAFNAMERILHPDTLTEAQKGHIMQTVKEVVAKTGKHFQTVYHGINEHFGVATYKDIPAARYPELCRYLGAEPLEGEWMPADDPTVINGVNRNHLYCLLSHFRAIREIWDNLGPGLRSLGVPYASHMSGHLADGYGVAHGLERRHQEELDAEYAQQVRNHEQITADLRRQAG